MAIEEFGSPRHRRFGSRAIESSFDYVIVLVVSWGLLLPYYPTPAGGPTKFARRPNAISLPTDTLHAQGNVYHLCHILYIYIYILGAELTSCHYPAQINSAQRAWTTSSNILNFNHCFVLRLPSTAISYGLYSRRGKSFNSAPSDR